MQAVWSAGACSVEAVHAAVGARLGVKEATVRTLLRRLEKKGYLRHEAAGRAYVYRAAESARSLAGRAVRQIVDRLCGRSLEELIAGMVEARVLSQADLDRLEDYVRSRPRKELAGKSGPVKEA